MATARARVAARRRAADLRPAVHRRRRPRRRRQVTARTRPTPPRTEGEEPTTERHRPPPAARHRLGREPPRADRAARRRAIYPDGHARRDRATASRENLRRRGQVRTATLDQPEHGLTEEVLADTDVLTWWGHAAHDEVDDDVVERVHQHVLAGMGLVVLHSGHWSKIFGKLMGTTCTLRWRSEHDRELVWTVNPTHPIARGVPNPIVIPEQEMYGEYFDIPAPDELVFISALHRRRGVPQRLHLPPRPRQDLLLQPRRPGLPRLPPPDVRRVIANAVEWAGPTRRARVPTLLRYDPGEFFDGQRLPRPARRRRRRRTTAWPHGRDARRRCRLVVGRRRRHGPGLAPHRRRDAGRRARRHRRPGPRRRRGRGAELAETPSIPVGTDAGGARRARPAPRRSRRDRAGRPPPGDDSRRCTPGCPCSARSRRADRRRGAARWPPRRRPPASCSWCSQSRRYNDQLVALREHGRELGGVGTAEHRVLQGAALRRLPRGDGRTRCWSTWRSTRSTRRASCSTRTRSRSTASRCNPSWSWYRGDAAAAAVFEFEGDVRLRLRRQLVQPRRGDLVERHWRLAARPARRCGTATAPVLRPTERRRLPSRAPSSARDRLLAARLRRARCAPASHRRARCTRT